MDKISVGKICFKCKQEKDISEFYAHPRMGDGRLGKCKECTKADVHANRVINIDKIREYDRGRGSDPKRIAKNIVRARKYRKSNPEKWKAIAAANRAIRSGKIKKSPCAVCGVSARIEKHHADYAKPLDVTFLCSMHHKRAHGMGVGY